jgi:dATP pyrophosphohydrolase
MRNTDLPIRIEAIVFSYDKENKEVRYLVIKRSEEDGGFWQPVTGTMEEGEYKTDCLMREIWEETSIDLDETKNFIIPNVYHFEWKKNYPDGTWTITEYVFGVFVSEENMKRSLTLSHEHTDYKWVNFIDALELFSMDNNKEALKRLDSYLRMDVISCLGKITGEF